MAKKGDSSGSDLSLVDSDSKIVKLTDMREIRGFWNMDEYPLPTLPTSHHHQLYWDFSNALDEMGFHGCLVMLSFGVDKHGRSTHELFRDHNFLHDKQCTLPNMVDEILYASFHRPKTLVVISKQPLEKELYRVLCCLNSRGCRVLLTDLTPSQDGLYSQDSIVESTRLLGGGKPTSRLLYDSKQPLYDPDVAEPEEEEEADPETFYRYIPKLAMDADISKIDDFSEPVLTCEGHKTGIFWDLEDYPFPDGATPDSIFQKVTRHLPLTGFDVGLTTTIWAYFDETKNGFLHKEKTWDSRLFFLPGGGDKPARLDRMLHDILLWEIDNPPDQPFDGEAIVVANCGLSNKEFGSRLMLPATSLYSVCRVQSDKPISPQSPRWPGSLFEQGFFAMTENPKRMVTKSRKPDH